MRDGRGIERRQRTRRRPSAWPCGGRKGWTWHLARLACSAGSERGRFSLSMAGAGSNERGSLEAADLTFAHIHQCDSPSSPRNDPTRVSCLCWHHHHGYYDQGYISTMELRQAEEIWIQNKRRPKPHPRDVALMKRVAKGEVVRQFAWTERRNAWSPNGHWPTFGVNPRLSGIHRE